MKQVGFTNIASSMMPKKQSALGIQMLQNTLKLFNW